MKKVVIIGGGIAGLSAGVHALQSGYQVEIYEKNPMPGGECTGWDRKGYHIDNCIHWLTGCNSGTKINELWRNIGAISADTIMHREGYVYMLKMNGVELHLWRDIERARKEFLDLAPEDTEEINSFFDAVKLAETIQVPCDKSPAHMNVLELMKLGMSMADMGKVMKKYGKETVGEFANRFKNPIVHAMLSKYYCINFMAYTLITSYAFYTSGSAAIPEGGSKKLVANIVNRFQELGGVLNIGKAVKEVQLEGQKATGVLLENDQVVSADYVICATDPAITFGKLLDKGYMDKKLCKMYGCRAGYPVNSNFHVSFGIDGTVDKGLQKGSVIFPCEKFTVGYKEQDFVGIRLYDYDVALFPQDKRVIQCNILQDEADYAYWENLYKDKEVYRETKLKIAKDIETRIIAQYPFLKDKLIFLDAYSPVTYTKWCGAYKGAYMSFFEQKGYKSLYVKNSIKGLKNVFLASQWLQTNGGLPVAATSGKFAVDRMKKQDRV